MFDLIITNIIELICSIAAAKVLNEIQIKLLRRFSSREQSNAIYFKLTKVHRLHFKTFDWMSIYVKIN